MDFGFWRKLALCAALALAPAAARAQPQTLIYFDNDFMGPGGSDLQSVIPLLHTKDAKLIGLGVVSGDQWMEEETQHLLRFMEIAGRGDIPVMKGATMPLLRTQGEMAAWAAQYGKIPWKGAWNTPSPAWKWVVHPDDPLLVPPMAEGAPKIAAANEDAAHFIIRQVHEHPGQVLIVAAGPLTDVALAIRLSPDVPALAKGLVFEGGYIDVNMAQATDDADYSTDFNTMFDPEATHIALTAPWKHITSIGHVAAPSVTVTKEVMDRIGASPSPVAQYVKRYAKLGEPFWDEVAVSIAIDPTLATKSYEARMDVDIMHGADYGRARLWNDKFAPPGLQPVQVIVSVDKARFIDGFVAAATR